MKTILFFHTSQRQGWRKELAGVYRFARGRAWRVQIVEPTKRPPDIAKLLAFWQPLGCLVECSGAAADYFDTSALAAVPAVYLGMDRRALPPTASFVNPSDRGPGKCAAIELMSAGFRNFAFVPATGDLFWSRDREADFLRTLRANAFPCAVFGCGASFVNARARSAALERWVKALPKPCGVFAANDYYASEVLDIAGRLRLNVPKALSVIGVDNDDSLCENARPKLSSVFLDYEQAGYRALEILAGLIAHPDAPPVRETYSALGLIRRGSTPAGIGTPPRISKVISFIRAHACDGISAADVVRKFPGSRRQAEIDFRNATGRSLLDEIQRVRFERLELLLRDRSIPLCALAGLCGWKGDNALRTAFLKRYGMSMRAWRNAAETSS